MQNIDEQILEAYTNIIKRGGGHKTHYTAMDELYIQLKTTLRISTDRFKAGMLLFYDSHNMKDFEFSQGSSIRKECNKYGFIVGGRLIFYMQKLPKDWNLIATEDSITK